MIHTHHHSITMTHHTPFCRQPFISKRNNAQQTRTLRENQPTEKNEKAAHTDREFRFTQCPHKFDAANICKLQDPVERGTTPFSLLRVYPTTTAGKTRWLWNPGSRSLRLNSIFFGREKWIRGAKVYYTLTTTHMNSNPLERGPTLTPSMFLTLSMWVPLSNSLPSPDGWG